MRIVNDKMIAWLMRDETPNLFPLCDFEKLRYEIRPCDVLLVEGRSRISEIIKTITQSSWSHAMLYLGRIHDIEDSAMKQRIIAHYPDVEDSTQLVVESLLGQGTIVAPLSNYRDDHIRICRPKGIAHQDAQKVIAYVINALGVPYDVRRIVDLLRFLLPWSILPKRWRSSLFRNNINEPIRQICSTLLAEAFNAVQFPILPVFKESQRTGVEMIQRNPRLYTPSDFDYSPFFEIIKYPIVDISLSRALYRHLPWNRDVYSNDDDKLSTPQTTSSNIRLAEQAKTGSSENLAPPAYQEINLVNSLKEEEKLKRPPKYYD